MGRSELLGAIWSMGGDHSRDERTTMSSRASDAVRALFVRIDALEKELSVEQFIARNACEALAVAKRVAELTVPDGGTLRYGIFSTVGAVWLTSGERPCPSHLRGMAVRFTSYDDAVAYRDARFSKGDIASPDHWFIVAWKE